MEEFKVKERGLGVVFNLPHESFRYFLIIEPDHFLEKWNGNTYRFSMADCKSWFDRIVPQRYKQVWKRIEK